MLSEITIGRGWPAHQRQEEAAANGRARSHWQDRRDASKEESSRSRGDGTKFQAGHKRSLRIGIKRLMCGLLPKAPKVPVPAQMQAMQVPQDMVDKRASLNARKRRGFWASIMTGPRGILGAPKVTSLGS